MCPFIRSLREGDFPLYVHVCDELCAWFHAMDHTHYARWVPVHVRDMVQLPETHLDKHAQFLKGNFVVQQLTHKFSLIGKDQSHEQSNKSIQSHGGAVGLYENPEALTLFMLAGPDCSSCVEEFEVVLDTPRSSTAHHEEAQILQVKYRKDVLSVVETVEQFGNPFGPGHELVALDTHLLLRSRKSSELLVGSINLAKSFMHNTLHRQSIKSPCQCQTLSDVTKS